MELFSKLMEPENNKNKKVIFITVAVIIIIGLGLFYFFYYEKNNNQPQLEAKPNVAESGIFGEILSVDRAAQKINVKNLGANGERNYIVSISSATNIVKIKTVLNKDSEVKAGFADLSEGQNISIAYNEDEKSDGAVLASRIEIIEFASPPANIIGDDYPKTPPMIK